MLNDFSKKIWTVRRSHGSAYVYRNNVLVAYFINKDYAVAWATSMMQKEIDNGIIKGNLKVDNPQMLCGFKNT
jgi:hypothetical protein